jgi:hypothetical protein
LTFQLLRGKPCLETASGPWFHLHENHTGKELGRVGMEFEVDQ